MDVLNFAKKIGSPCDALDAARVSYSIQLIKSAETRVGSPLVELNCLTVDETVPDGVSATLVSVDGHALGSGIFDRRDPVAAWRRFSHLSEEEMNESYLLDALQQALEFRGEEPCRRIVSSDADFLPGLIVEQYGDVLTVCAQNTVMDQHLAYIGGLLQEWIGAVEVVLLNDHPVRQAFEGIGERITLSGNGLKGRWIEVDGLTLRVDLLDPRKPIPLLDQREQQVLVASLTEGRCLCDAFAGAGGFALHAARAGAEHVVALDADEMAVKAIGAQAQKNECFVETIHSEVGAFLDERDPGELEVIVLDPPNQKVSSRKKLISLQEKAFSCLGSGGILATYCRSTEISSIEFEQMVAQAAASTGRDARVFARTTQPFDFPALLSLPGSRRLKGLIVQVI